MNFSTYGKSDQQEIVALFTRTFSESEGQAEGELIGRLVHELMTGTRDMFGFIATDQERMVGCIFFTRLSFDSPVEAFLLSPVFELTHPEGWLGQSLDGGSIELLPGKARCVEPFNDARYW